MAGKILIFGGNGGIGSATARLLAESGHRLHLACRHPDGQALADALGAGCSIGDVLDESFISRAANEAGETLDGLLYAVGSITLKALPRLSRADFLRDFELNALGAALAVQAALPALKRSGRGSVVLFSSIAASQGFALHASIGMAKAALEGLTRSLAAELAPAVRINAIAPSLTRTPLSGQLWRNPATAEGIAGMHPIPRLGTAADMASLASFLLSEQAGWITGQIIGVDGGRSSLRVKG